MFFNPATGQRAIIGAIEETVTRGPVFPLLVMGAGAFGRKLITVIQT